MNSCIALVQTVRPSASHAFHKSYKNWNNCRVMSSCNSNKKKALVFLAPGHEEIEFVTTVDVLRRGGVDVTIASTAGKDPILGSRGILTKPDVDLADVCGKFDALILPGGLGGSKAMANCPRIGEMLKEQEQACRIIAAICAAPTALQAHGIGKGMNLTSYPAMEATMKECGDYCYKCDDVVVDKFLITSRGPATAMKFALTILLHLTDESKACEVAKAMLVK